MSNHSPRGSTYSGYPEFDNLQARHVRTTERVGMTRDGWKIKQTVVVCDFGKPDRTAADPDALLADTERLPREPYPANRRSTKSLTPRANPTQARTVAYIQEHGPSSIPDMARCFGLEPSTVHKHVTRREGYVYARVGKRGGADLWGLTHG